MISGRYTLDQAELALERIAAMPRSSRRSIQTVSAERGDGLRDGTADGKTAVISGASSGMGRVACARFCMEGATVVGSMSTRREGVLGRRACGASTRLPRRV
jgi:hypothetical protein